MSSPATTTQARKIAIIAGAGPAGLTAALELLRRSDVKPLVFDADFQVGGISKTVNYRGNRMDLGGHRFFSKSDWVMRWWQQILPVSSFALGSGSAIRLDYQNQSRDLTVIGTADPSREDVLLVRQRLSRIFYRRRFFDYPLKLNVATIRNMGVMETLRVGLSYGHARMLKKMPETSLEDFFINRFGERLYRTFFKDYTEKVWGVACNEISADWGAQRIKGLSVGKAIAHAIASRLRIRSDATQRRTETSLIERFLYPKYGPGQMWNEVARRVGVHGGEVNLRQRVVGIDQENGRIAAVVIRDEIAGSERRIPCDFFISTMPVRDLVQMLRPVQDEVLRIANRLPYRDFITIGLLLKSMTLRDARSAINGMPPDNWIYIQEADVRVGRIQVFNNWSPALVADPSTIWLGLEYFCSEGDGLWSMPDADIVEFATRELEKIGMIDRQVVMDATVVRVAKAYPAYFGEYRQFDQVRRYLDGISNLYPVGRNGMHRYNNQDHSMLAADAAVTSIVSGRGKDDLWAVNADSEYHEGINEVA